MATILSKCSECGAPVQMRVGQALLGLELVWNSGFACEACGAQIEMDDTGMPPENVRNAIIQANGLWSVHVNEEGASKARIVKALRRIFGWSLAKAADALKDTPGAVHSGTRVEAEWIRQQLQKDGISSWVDQEVSWGQSLNSD